MTQPDSTTNTGAVEALAERCQQRASELSDEAELCEIEAAALLGQKEARWAEWEGGMSNAAMVRWRTFLDRLSELQRNAKATREDVEHYRECAAALRATPTPASEAEVIDGNPAADALTVALTNMRSERGRYNEDSRTWRAFGFCIAIVENAILSAAPTKEPSDD